ncbi:MAG TPA: FAD-binding oxidoreductase, partial [Acidimicrobiales bacterium]|nr:FAD-binding oxidoreductase [Acidimicrobiales bacterium]
MPVPAPPSATSSGARAHRGVRRLLESRLVGALARPHGVDHYLTAAGMRWATAAPPARVVDARSATPGTVTLTLRPAPGWAGHVAGQHVRLTVPVGGVRRVRCFSISSSPRRADGLVELTVKANGAGGVSDHLVRRTGAGDLVELSAATGDFVLPDRRPPHVVLVSGGSGITPVLSMLRALVDEEAATAVSFLHYARTPDDVIAGAELAAIARRRPDWRIVVALTGPGEGMAGRTTGGPVGRFRPDHVDSLVGGALEAPVWVCGPP